MTCLSAWYWRSLFVVLRVPLKNPCGLLKALKAKHRSLAQTIATRSIRHAQINVRLRELFPRTKLISTLAK
jgi:hypothetical protein